MARPVQVGFAWRRPTSAFAAWVEVAVVVAATYAAASLIGHPLASASPLAATALAHVAFVAVPLVVLLAVRRRLETYGFTLRGWRGDLRTAMSAYLPVALASAACGFVDFRTWSGTVLVALAFAAALVATVRQVRPDPRAGIVTIGLTVIVLGAYGAWQGLWPGLGRAAGTFATYAVLVGVGEEALYRGFVQSRLDDALGLRFETAGVRWGWGLLLAAVLFGLSHTGVVAWALRGEATWSWPWGVWTTVHGLVLGFVRAKTGSILAPAVLHGLPQAIAAALLGA